MEVLRNLCLPGNPKDKYEKKERIGQGSFGRVYKGVERKAGEIVAIKVIDLAGVEPQDYEVIGQEIQMLKETKERHVLKFYGAYINKKDTKLWLVTEFINGGNAKELAKPSRMEEMFIAIILRGVIEALAYLHEKEKIHRDIKAENILVSSEGEVKLVDFGVSARLVSNEDKRHTVAGTPYWMAPEVITQQGHDSKADIWSVGITSIELATGRVPHDDISPMKLAVVITQTPPPTLEGKYSADFKHFVSVCLKKNPLERPSAKQLLQHNFIAKAKSTVYLKDVVARFIYWKSNQREEPTDSEKSNHEASSVNSESDSDDSRRRKSISIHSEDERGIMSYTNFVVSNHDEQSNGNTPLNRSVERLATNSSLRTSGSSLDNEGYNTAAAGNRKVNPLLDYSAEYYEDLEEPEDEERDTYKKRFSLNDMSLALKDKTGKNSPSPNMQRRMMKSAKSKSRKGVRGSKTLTLTEIEEKSNEESSDFRNGASEDSSELKRQSSKASNASKRKSLALGLPTTLPVQVLEEEILEPTTSRVPFDPVSNPRGPVGMGGSLVKAAGTDVFEYRPNAVGADNLIDMPKIDLAPILDNLHKRYNNSVPYTYADNILISVNPEKQTDIYTRLFMRNFRHKVMFQMPPHIFAMAESAYANCMNLNRAQALVLLGLSGSGKTESLKHIINYYSVLSSPLTRSDTSTLLIESLTVLEAFGNAKSVHNNNSTRFIMNLDLFFEPFGGVVGAKLNTYGLQKTRVCASQKNERGFHIFYWLLANAAANKEERKKYSLKPLEKYNYLRNGSTSIDGENAIGEFNKVNNAFSILRIDEGSRAWIYRGLSAVLLLGNVDFKHSNKKGCKISSESDLKTIGDLLDVKHSLLMNIICPDKNTFTLQEAMSRRDAFARGLYGQIFNHVVELLNDRLARTVTKSMITIFDHYGFEGLEDNNFEQLTVNYFAEKMHQFVNTQVIEVEQALYRGEKLEWATYASAYDKGPLDLVERILTIIEDESTPKEGSAKPTDESVFESIFSKLYRNPHFSSRPGTTNFQIEHTSGKIKYNADAFLRSNDEPMQFRSMLTQLPKGKNPFFNLDEEQYLLRSAAQVKVTMTNLSSMLLSSQLMFVACIKPGPKKNATLDPIFVRAQIKALQLLDIAKMRTRAFPVHLSPYIFMRLFSPLDRQAIDAKELLTRNSSTAYYRLTKTKLFLRSMEYYKFEAMMHKERDQATLKLQCLLRMQLARAKLLQWVKALTRIQAQIRMKKTQERVFSQLSTKETRRLRKGGGGSSRGLSRSETIAADSDLSVSVSTDTDVSPKKRRKSMAPGSLTLETIASSEESDGARDKSKSSRRSKPSKQNSMMNVLVSRGGKKFKDGSKKDRSLHAQSMMIDLSPRDVPQTARPSSSGSLDLGDGVTSRPSVPFVLPAFLATNPHSPPPAATGTGTGEKQSSGSDTEGPTLKTRRSARQFTRQPTIGRTPSRPNNELISPEMRDSINASIEAEMKEKSAAASSADNTGKDNTALNVIRPEISIVEPPKRNSAGELDSTRKLSMAQEIRPDLDKITEVKEPETPKEEPVVAKPEEKPTAPTVPVEATESQPVKVEPPKVEEPPQPQPVKPPVPVDVKLPDAPLRRRSSSEVSKNRVPRTTELAPNIPEEVEAPVVVKKPAEPPRTPEPIEPRKPEETSPVLDTPPAAKPQLVSKNSVRSRLALFESAISARQQTEQKSPESPPEGPKTEGRLLNRRKTFSSLSASAVVTSPSNVVSSTNIESASPVKGVKIDEVKQPSEVAPQPVVQETSTPAAQKDTTARPPMTRQGSVQNLKRTSSFTRTEEIFNSEFKKTLEPLLGPLELQFTQMQSAHQRMMQHLNGPSFNPTAFINFLDMMKHVTTQFDHSLTEAIDKSKIALKSKRVSGDQNTTPGLAPTTAGLVSVKEDEELKAQQTPVTTTTPRSGSNASLITPRSSRSRSTELPSASTAPTLNKTNNTYLKSFSPIIVANFHLATFELEKEAPNVDSIISKFKYCLTSGLDVFTLPEYLNNKHKLETQQKFREAFPDKFASGDDGQKERKDEIKAEVTVVVEPNDVTVTRTQSTPATLPSISLKSKLEEAEEDKAKTDVATDAVTSPKEPTAEQVLSPKTDPKVSLKSPKRTESEPLSPKGEPKATAAKTPRDSTPVNNKTSTTPTPRSSRASSAHTSVDLTSDTASNASDSKPTPVSTPKTTPKSGLKEPVKVDSTRKSSGANTASTASTSRIGTYSPSTTKKDTTTSPTPAASKKTPTTTTPPTTNTNGTSVASPSGLKRPSVLKKPSGGNLTGGNNVSSPSATPEKDSKTSGSATTTASSGSPAASGLKKPSTVSGLKQPGTSSMTSSPSSGLKKFSSAKK